MADRLVARSMIDPQRGAQRSAGIARRGLGPHVLKRAPIAQIRIEDAIERNTAGKIRINEPFPLLSSCRPPA